MQLADDLTVPRTGRSAADRSFSTPVRRPPPLPSSSRATHGGVASGGVHDDESLARSFSRRTPHAEMPHGSPTAYAGAPLRRSGDSGHIGIGMHAGGVQGEVALSEHDAGSLLLPNLSSSIGLRRRQEGQSLPMLRPPRQSDVVSMHSSRVRARTPPRAHTPHPLSLVDSKAALLRAKEVGSGPPGSGPGTSRPRARYPHSARDKSEPDDTRFHVVAL